jgi:arsenite-transporting ATPase
LAILVPQPTPVLFFTGKGGVGKTSSACATALKLADGGARVLLVSTDPASNLDEVLGVALSGTPLLVPGADRLWALNIDPEAAAHAYRERTIGPVRGLLPATVIASMEEQLSGACTSEIAAFEAFAHLLGDTALRAEFDHIVFDTAPTGHTLRLLELPAAWTTFIEDNVGGNSCLGPLSGLAPQKALFASAHDALRDAACTTLVLVSRPDVASLKEAERTRHELANLGVHHLHLILNGVFEATNRADVTALALERRGTVALEAMAEGLRSLPRTTVGLRPHALLGLTALRSMGEVAEASLPLPTQTVLPVHGFETWADLLNELATSGRGAVMTMGKGGVGKTTLAARLALNLSERGLKVTLTTTDPAAHVAGAVGCIPESLQVTRIDPGVVTARYREEVLAEAGKGLDAAGLALLEEDLRSPCTEEVAVFRAFAETVACGMDRIVVVDTAPTGHTLLLLDAAEAYHREVLRKASGTPEAVRLLLPRLRDPEYTRVLLVTLPEATPIHEAMQLERDLARAEIRPRAWIVNQSLTPLTLSDPVLKARQAAEGSHLVELLQHTPRILIEPLNLAQGAPE